MALACSILTVTWYPGTKGNTSGSPFVILESGDEVDGDTMFSGGMRQLVQAGNYLRGTQPDHWVRGQRETSMEFTRYSLATDPRAGLVSGFAHMLSLPEATGWLLLEIDDEETNYAIDKVAFEELGYDLRRSPKYLGRRYRFRGGALTVYSGDAPTGTYAPGEIMEGPAVNRGALLRGPNRTYPAE